MLVAKPVNPIWVIVLRTVMQGIQMDHLTVAWPIVRRFSLVASIIAIGTTADDPI